MEVPPFFRHAVVRFAREHCDRHLGEIDALPGRSTQSLSVGANRNPCIVGDIEGCRLAVRTRNGNPVQT